MLEDKGVQYQYREYTLEPLSVEEIEAVLKKSGLRAKDIFRKNDAANRELRLTGEEPREQLTAQMAAHPTLLQRPIGILGRKAVLGRPPEKLLSLVGVD